MANRPATGYTGPQLAITGVPNVNLDDGTGTGLSKIGALMFQGGEIFAKKSKRQQVLKAEEDGSLYGLRNTVTLTNPDGTTRQIPGVSMAPGSDEVTKAFNKASISSYLQRIETVSRETVMRLELSNRFNPDEFQKQVGAFKDGLTETAPVQVKAALEAQIETLAAPRYLAIHERRIKASVTSMAADAEAAAAMRLSDMQSVGSIVGQGGAAAGKALDLMASTYFGGVKQIQGRVDGFIYTAGEANRDIVAFTSQSVASGVRGIYDGTQDKQGFYQAYLKGDLRVPIPTVVEDGSAEPGADGRKPMKATIVLEDPRKFMTIDDQNKLKSYLDTQYTELRSMKDKARIDAERAGGDIVRNNLRALSTSGDASVRKGAFDAVVNNPWATDQDVTRARKWMIDGVTNDGYMRMARSSILAGQVADPLELDPTMLSFEDRDKLSKMIDAQQGPDHWTKATAFTSAVKLIRLDVANEANEVVVNVFQGQDREKIGQTAANRMELALRYKVQDHLDAGGIIGHNPNGQPFLAVKTKNQANGETIDVERFDPVAWSRQQIQAVRDRLGPLQIKLEAARKAMREPGADALRALGEVKQLQTQIRSAFEVEILQEFN